MTVESQVSKAIFIGDGAATNFAAGFKAFQSSHIQVSTEEIATGVLTSLVLDTDYTLTNINTDDAIEVQYPISGSPLAATHKLIVNRVVPLQQLLSISNQGGFFPETLEEALDKIVQMQIQQQTELNQTFRLGVAETAINAMSSPDRADKMIYIDTDGQPTLRPLQELVTLEALLVFNDTAPSSGNLWYKTVAPTGLYGKDDTGTWIKMAESPENYLSPFASWGDFNTWAASNTVADGYLATVISGDMVVQFRAHAATSVFGLPSGWMPVGSLRPEHFGDLTYDVAFDCSPYINRAISFLNTTLGGGVVHLCKSPYFVQNQIIMRSGITIEGEGATSPGNTNEGGSTIKAGANLTYLLAQNNPATDAGQNFTLRNLTIHGNSGGGFTVGTGVAIRGRQIRVENCNITYCTGVGLHLLNTNHAALPGGYAWVNWVQNCNVSYCDTGFFNETSDSYFSYNYFTNNRINRTLVSGGNVWVGNHFDHADVGLSVEYDPDWFVSGVPQLNDRFIGNYFDLNIQGILIDGTQAVSGSTTFASVTLTGNYYRSNNIHVTLKNLAGVTINGGVMRECADRTGGSGPYAGVFAGVLFDTVRSTTVSGLLFEDGFNVEDTVPTASMPVFAGRDVSLTQVQNCHVDKIAGTISSEWAQIVTLPMGDTSVTVNTALLGDIHNLSIAQEGGGAGVFRQYRISNRSGRNFDIEIDSAVGAADLTFHVKASMSR